MQGNTLDAMQAEYEAGLKDGRLSVVLSLQAERDAIAAEVERDGGNQMFVEIADRMIGAAKGAGR